MNYNINLNFSILLYTRQFSTDLWPPLVPVSNRVDLNGRQRVFWKKYTITIRSWILCRWLFITQLSVLILHAKRTRISGNRWVYRWQLNHRERIEKLTMARGFRWKNKCTFYGNYEKYLLDDMVTAFWEQAHRVKLCRGEIDETVSTGNASENHGTSKSRGPLYLPEAYAHVDEHKANRQLPAY